MVTIIGIGGHATGMAGHDAGTRKIRYEKTTGHDHRNRWSQSSEYATALTSLQERGFVRITAQVGCEVISPTPDEIQDFYRMFAAVEGVIASLAARRATGDEIGRLAEINHQLTAVPPDSSPADVYRQINVLFHRQLHDMAHSSLVSARQQANFELSDFFIVQTCGFDAHLHLVAEEHQVLIDAISARDSERAAIMAQAHILSVSDSVASYLHVQRAQ